MADIQVVCDECHGTRFNEETRTVRWRGHDIAEVLALSIDDATKLFEDIRRLRRLWNTAAAGMDSLRQPSTTVKPRESSWPRNFASAVRAIPCTSWMNRRRVFTLQMWKTFLPVCMRW